MILTTDEMHRMQKMLEEENEERNRQREEMEANK